jgi:vacuolar-type H+-ATPase subunit E/Vma4
MKLNKGLKFKEILKKAKKTYKKVANAIVSNFTKKARKSHKKSRKNHRRSRRH